MSMGKGGAGDPAERDLAPRRRVYLVRHGAVAHVGADGTPLAPEAVTLTETGRAQAAAVGALLRSQSLDRVVCSDLPRARQTADLLIATAGAAPLAVEEKADFREVGARSFGDLPADVLQAAIIGTYDRAPDADSRYIEGEPFRDAWARVLAGWEELLNAPDWRTLVLVGHDCVNRIVLSHVSGAGLPGLRAFEQDLGCINIIELAGPDSAFLRAVNLTPLDPVKDGLWLTSMERVWRGYAGGGPG